MIAYKPETAGDLLGLHALTALHPGGGASLETVDLPIQRERHTLWPNIAGSAVKGVLRDCCRENLKGNYQDEIVDGETKKTRRAKADDDVAITRLFGPSKERAKDGTQANEHAGSMMVTDARLLAFPVRSMRGVFAWVTCPAVIERLQRDASMVGQEVPAVDTSVLLGQQMKAFAPQDCPCTDQIGNGKYVLLEEFNIQVIEGDASPMATWVADHLLPSDDSYANTRERFKKQMVIVTDDDFTHFVRYATEIAARIRLDYETKTVEQGALFYQEFLPTETVLYAALLVNEARSGMAPKGSGANSATALIGEFAEILKMQSVLQIGGDETTGKGFCGLRLMNNGGAK